MRELVLTAACDLGVDAVGPASRGALRRALGVGTPAVLAVSPCDDAGLPTAPVVAALRRQRPDLHIIAVHELHDGAEFHLVRLVAAGCAACCLDTAGDVARALHAGLLSTRNGSPLPEVPTRAWRRGFARAFERAVRCARAGLGTDALARVALGRSRRMLERRFREREWPPPGALMRWARLYVAAELLANGAGVGQALRGAGFGGARHYLRVLGRLGLAPEGGMTRGVRHAIPAPGALLAALGARYGAITHPAAPPQADR